MLKLYHGVFSPCAQKVRLIIAEKEIPWTSREINLLKKENLEPWYLEIAPKGLVPVLDHNGQIVTESTIICEYLEDAFPEVPLRPIRPIDKARARTWMKLVDDSLHPSAGPIIFGSLMRYWWLQAPVEERARRLALLVDPARRQRQQTAIDQGLDAPAVEGCISAWIAGLVQLERRLATAEWLAGDLYSIADAAVTPYVFFMDALGMSVVFERYPAVRQWYERIRARPNFRRALVDAAPADQWEAIRHVAKESGPILNGRVLAREAA
jgi:glutathione S-transferase